MTEEVEVELWDKRPDEPLEWYQKFVRYYLYMGFARSVRKAYRAYLAEGKAKEDIYNINLGLNDTHTAVRRWHAVATEWQWEERAVAWDQKRNEDLLLVVDEAAAKLKQHSVNAVDALILSLGTNRAVQAAKEILDRAGLPATTKHEMSGKLTFTADDMAEAANEVDEWEKGILNDESG